MNDILRFGQFDGVQLGVFQDGTTFASAGGLATLCDVKVDNITDLGQDIPSDTTGKFRTDKIVALLKQYEFEGNKFYELLEFNGQIIQAYYEPVCMAFLEYYAYEAGKRCTEKAKNLARRLMRKSFRDFVYALVGYKQQQTSFSDYMLDRITYHHQVSTNPLPDGYFCLFDKMIEILQKFDSRLKYKLGEQWYDTRNNTVRFLEPDISLGLRFSQFFTNVDVLTAQANYDCEYNNQFIKSKKCKFWTKKLITLKWQLEIAKVEDLLKVKYKIPTMITKNQVDQFTCRKKYNFKPSPDSGRPSELDAYCYPNEHLPLYQYWLSEVFFKFFWKDYILERDSQGWMKKYNDFKAMPLSKQNAILTTTEGKMIQGFDFYDQWYKSLPVDPRP